MGILLDLSEPLWVRQTRAEIEDKRRLEAPFVFGDADLRIPEPDEPRRCSSLRYLTDRIPLVPTRNDAPGEGILLTFPRNRLAVCQPQ